MNAEPDDAQRYPTLSAEGRRMLDFMREHAAAPIFRNASGNRLTAADLEALRTFEADVLHAPIGWRPGVPPAWVEAFVAAAFREVPHYRRLGLPPRRFEDLPSTRRADLAADIAAFVPDSVAPDRLINFRTTGTTGTPLLIASHPQVAGRYLTFHKRALRRFGIEPRHGRGQVGVAILGHQRRCFTYVSVTPMMDESGLAKINLHPNDWHRPDDRRRYLEALAPEIIAGDPLSFAELLEVDPDVRPRALLSVAMMLLPGLRQRLEARFACPVLDLYSLNEAGPVGVLDDALGGHVLLQPMLYVEILDQQGRALAPGERGEVTLTGGFNFCLPLIRYRTGDFAALADTPEAPVLVGLQGRDAVRFRSASGEWINNIDVTHALGDLPLAQFALHQAADGALTLQLAPSAMAYESAVRGALARLLGALPLQVRILAADDKVLQYTSHCPLARC